MRKRMETHFQERILTFLILLLAFTHLTAGAEPNSAPLEKKVSVTTQQRLRTMVTYSCVDTPIEKVLMDLADQAKVDIVKSPKVTGNVTVKLTGVPLEEALTNILAAYDYTYIATESMIRVVPLPEVAALREQLITRIYQVTYADANKVATALKGFLSERGKIALDKGTSHIIVTDTGSKIKAIDKFIKQIDLVTPQVLVEVRIYDITSKEGLDLETNWHAGRNAPLTADIIHPTETTTTVTAPTRTDYSETTSGIYRDSDDGTTPKSYTVGGWTENDESTVTETRVTEPPMMTNFRRKPFVGGSFDRVEGGALNFSLLNDAVDIDLTLSLLRQRVQAKLLANPRVLVVDNETAKFDIVREIPYRELRQVARADPITYTAFKNVGVKLKVTPHITRDGMIRLHITPEFGVLVNRDPQGVPTVDTRRADTVALVKNAQTIVIGGLRKRQTSKDISKVPLLGDIPLIGGLFRSETESAEVNELVVFITPRIVTEPVLSDLEKKQLGQTEFASPEMKKLKLERNGQDKKEAEKSSVKGALDKLLQELESPKH